ncbi:sporulation histidine kinase inhibitor Sda [uncultured Paraglaciecola sp.]
METYSRALLIAVSTDFISLLPI